MNKKILVLILTSLVSLPSFAESPPKVFISASFSTIPNCNYNRFGQFGADTITEWIKADLTKAGYAIAKSKSEATNGIEANVKITWCGTLSGDVESHSGSVGMAALSRGTSAAAPGLKEVPFNYATKLAVAGGEPDERHALKLIKYLKEHVDSFVANTFQ